MRIFLLITIMLLTFVLAGCFTQRDVAEEPIQAVVNQTIPFRGGTYTGELKNDKPHGKGIFEMPDGYRYEGSWKNGLKDGNAVITFPDGTSYRGTMQDDQFHGQGVLFDSDGSVIYEGSWKNGEPCAR